VQILGPLEVSSDLGPLSLGGRKPRVVLACLDSPWVPRRLSTFE
jgi:hypothetical protein